MSSQARLPAVACERWVHFEQVACENSGSGMTAAIVGLALHKLGKGSMLYDGSWSEYGLPGEHPVVKTADE